MEINQNRGVDRVKKVFRLLMIVSFVVTIYTVVFWKPKEYSNYSLEEKAEKTFNDGLGNNIDVDNAKVREGSTKSIFRVSEEVMKNSITEDDGDKVDTIIKNMSEVDVDRIRREEKNVDKEAGTEEIFKILNRRLSSKDYKIIKSIYDPYIDFTVIQ